MVRAWIGWFVALNLLWLLLISSFVVAEEVLGLFASAVAATAAVAVGRQRLIRFRPRLRWVYALRRLPLRAVRETWLVIGALLRQLAGGRPARGHFLAVPVSLPDDPMSQRPSGLCSPPANRSRRTATCSRSTPSASLMLVHRLITRSRAIRERLRLPDRRRRCCSPAWRR